MDLTSLSTLKSFPTYSYADIAMRRWKGAVDSRTHDIDIHLIDIIEGYAMALEQMMKFILTRSEGLDRTHQHSHNVWALACDIELPGREKYSRLLRKYSAYYNDDHYEAESIEARQAVYDYFRDKEVLDKTDELLYILYGEAQDLARRANQASPQKFKPSATMDLFGKNK